MCDSCHKETCSWSHKICYDKKNPETEEIITKSLSAKEISALHAKLVGALSRGGLWYINENMERIFVIAEKYFCIKISNHMSKITVFDLVKNLLELPQVQSIFKLIVDSADVEISKEVAKSTLYGILTLYIRVRSFSFAKDTVERQKIKKNSNVKGTRNRKQLKNMNDTESLQQHGFL